MKLDSAKPAQRRSAQAPPQAARRKEAQGDKHGDIEEELRVTVVKERRRPLLGSQIPRLLQLQPT